MIEDSAYLSCTYIAEKPTCYMACLAEASEALGPLQPYAKRWHLRPVCDSGRKSRRPGRPREERARRPFKARVPGRGGAEWHSSL
jgi:hypothetical protein